MPLLRKCSQSGSGSVCREKEQSHSDLRTVEPILATQCPLVEQQTQCCNLQTFIYSLNSPKSAASVRFLQEKGINLTHIESRPSRKNNDQYEFFINVDSNCSQALDEVIDGLRTQISGHVHELSRNKEKDTGEGVCVCVREDVH